MPRLRVGLRFHFAFLLLSVFLTGRASFAQTSNQDDPLTKAAERVRKHVDIIKEAEKGAEGQISSLLQGARKDWDSTTYQGGHKGAKRHPWIEQSGGDRGTGVNPNSANDYYMDSQRVVLQNLPTTWSCFQPQLVAKGFCSLKDNPATDIEDDEIAPGSRDLALECRKSCPCRSLPPPFEIEWKNDTLAPLGGPQNGYEVTQYWIPEYEGERNEWGVMAFNPANEPGGSVFLRSSLIGSKGQGESEIRNQLSQNYPLDMGNLKLPDRGNQNIGHNLWGGYAAPHLEDTASVHVWRSLYMKSNTPTLRKTQPSPAGWSTNPTTILDAFYEEKDSPTQKHVLSMWTEYGFYEALTKIPQLSMQAGALGAAAMPALFGSMSPMKEVAKQSPYWQKGGALAHRIARWPDYYGEIGKVLKISGKIDPVLGEVTYIGGHELFPLTMSLGGFETPNISSALFMIRRGYEIAGMRELVQHNPFGEAGRMNQYTVKGDPGSGDPNRGAGGKDQGMEVDKFQLLAPIIGSNTVPSECMRSQKIPNMVEQTEDPWVVQNLPAGLESYVELHKSSVRTMYWNKRVTCSCKTLGLPFGSWAMDVPFDKYGPGRGTGDRKYGKIEDHLCEYMPGTIPSGWAGSDQPSCKQAPGPDYYRGTDDRV